MFNVRLNKELLYVSVAIGLSLVACQGFKPNSPTREEVTVTPQSLTLYEGRGHLLHGEPNVNLGSAWIIWNSSNYSVAYVTPVTYPYYFALVQVWSPGTARITAYVYFDVSAGHCDVTVLPVTAWRIDIQPDTVTLAVDSLTFIAGLVYDSVGVILERSVLWHSADSSIASVSGQVEGHIAKGLVWGRGPGRTYIIASTEGLSDSSLVVVK